MLRGILLKPYNRSLMNFVPKANVFRGQHMDDLPVPCGDWLKTHRNRNAFYNIVLALGVSQLIIGTTVIFTNVEFNFSPPANYD